MPPKPKEKKEKNRAKTALGKEKEKAKEKEKTKKKPEITEEQLLRIQRAKEERSWNLFYRLAEPEPEEEPLEQKIARRKKELKDNTFP